MLPEAPEEADLRGDPQLAAAYMKAAMGSIFAADPERRCAGLAALRTLAAAYGVPNAVFGKLFDQTGSLIDRSPSAADVAPELIAEINARIAMKGYLLRQTV